MTPLVVPLIADVRYRERAPSVVSGHVVDLIRIGDAGRPGRERFENSIGATTVLDREEENRLMSRREARKHLLGTAVAAITFGADTRRIRAAGRYSTSFRSARRREIHGSPEIRKAIEAASRAHEAEIQFFDSVG